MKFSFGSSSFKDDIKALFSSDSTSDKAGPQTAADVAARRGTLTDLRVLAQYDTIFVIDGTRSQVWTRSLICPSFQPR
ncbi:hypothetical protein M407DRAFT_242645 [Tulasnella calospora MUT 4182]|uniref:Uncharacterized protein n=1 Tax=Tulasnella calospora MUT 4182 TaxID=1051891 RepID=A0A0C3QN65_9AGAM|nr:hypothetical protein M407DRAFT_242645 [Tulasnella calospora MUT 4182]